MKSLFLFLFVTLSSVCFSQTVVFDSVMVGNIVDDSTVVWDSTYTQKLTTVSIYSGSIVVDSDVFSFVSREKSNDGVLTYTAINFLTKEEVKVTYFLDCDQKFTLILDRSGKSYYFNK
jgi:hypothetical protein